MSGTVKGGLKASKTNKRRYGKDFYKRIGSKGGKVETKKGFATNPDLASRAGSKGGKKSRRRKNG